ncbi:urease accessory protein UreE [Acidimangrovimonas pyrenivorans]|uniref:Urease accessory protein UreE n=1 Tax=Acidimangrovimonas pyrenivorans TaxID=2030798 RepID=A0ABV7AFL7_9RHOB
MTDLPPARSIRRASEASAAPQGQVTLSYDDRFLRRKRLETDAGDSLLVDLAETVSLDQGDCFVLEDGREIAVAAAEEPLVAVTGDLPRLAWHVGNRHTPCQVEEDRLLIRRDHVLEDMLKKLGAGIALVTEPFRPEGGAYGHGRTMGHDHGHDHGHEHGHDHGHVHHHVSHYHPDEDDEEDGEPETIR